MMRHIGASAVCTCARELPWNVNVIITVVTTARSRNLNWVSRLSGRNSSIARYSNAKEKESKGRRDSERGAVIHGERRWKRDSRSMREQEKHDRAGGCERYLCLWLGRVDLIDVPSWGQSQDMTRIHCGSHYYNIYYTHILHATPISPRATWQRERSEGEVCRGRMGTERYECNNPPTLFSQPVREYG